MSTPQQQQQQQSAETPWHAAFPAPKSTAQTITREEVLPWIKERKVKGPEASVDFVLVDLRRADHEGGTISTSINLPAQSLYPALPIYYNLFKQAGVKKVIFYCGSSAGRGTRAGGWFADYIKERSGEREMESLVLAGGIKGWVAAGEEFVQEMDGYEASVWQKKGN